MHKQQGWLQAWEYCQEKPIQTLARASQGVNWSWSQCIKSHHAHTSSGKELPATSETETSSEASYLGYGEEELDCCSVVQSPLSDESTFCVSFVNQGPRVWRKRGEAQNPCCLKSSVKFPVSDDLGCRVICWCWSTVFSEVHSQRSHLPGHFRALQLPSADQLYGDPDFIFQQDLAPAHTAKGTGSWFNDLVLLCLIDQQTRQIWTP